MAILFDGNTQVGGVTNVGTTIEDKTMAEYNALTPEQQNNGDYCITDLDLVPLKAENVPYGSSDVKSALDSVNTQISNLGATIKLKGTMTQDVLAYIKNMENGAEFFINSNQPANCPTNCLWGSYLLLKSSGTCTAFYIDRTHIAGAYNITNSSASIDWHIV